MPIRFRCAHCDKLLGIARRKAGSIVNCPQCGQPLIVPTPEEAPPEADVPDGSTHQAQLPTDEGTKGLGPQGRPAGGAKLFEADEIDRLLDMSPTVNPLPYTDSATHHHPAGASPYRMVPQPYAASNGVPMPLPMPMPVPAALPIPVPTAGGLTVGRMIVLILIVFVLVTGAFVGGFFVGKGMK